MDQNFNNNGFNNQTPDSNGWNNQPVQQDYTQQYNQMPQQDYAQQYNQAPQQDYAQQYNQAPQQDYAQQYQSNTQMFDQVYQSPQYNAPYVQGESKGNGLGIASLVLGIVSIVTFCLCCVSLPLSITGLILGIISKVKKKENNGIAIAGIIVSAVALVAVLGFWLFAIISGEASYTDYNSYL
ncbi:MAG: DUF4190 domain-containing protein [Ruminococcus sp.]|nr:DUF4190 domain-containing protein [Ruminococcus sp.]